MSKSSLNAVERTLALLYGVVAYASFLFTILYAIGFVGNLWPVLGLHAEWLHGMDIESTRASLGEALLVDAGLLALFAGQHSGMARRGFKRWWTTIVPEQVERSTFVLTASICLCVLFQYWRPIGTLTLWDMSSSAAGRALAGLSIVGWAIVFAATFMIDHFDLFGLRQSWFAFRGRAYPELTFKTPGLYKIVRHPIYLGFIIAFWATPVMTAGHLLFAGLTTAYVLVAIQLEERDLIHRFGPLYRQYRERVRMLLPLPPSPAPPPDSSAPETFRPVP